MNVLRLSLLLGNIFFFLSGCTDKRDLSKNIVLAHITSEPDDLHPTNGNSANRTYVFQYTQKRLIRPDLITLEMIPELVESLPEISDDGLRYTYTLKKGVTWDDGSPLTLEDVIFTLKMIKCPLTDNAAIRSYFNRIETISTYPDEPRKFTMVCNDIYYANPIIWATDIYILQKSHWDPNNIMGSISIKELNDPAFNADDHPGLANFIAAFNEGSNGRDPDKLVGLGPYKVTEWNLGNSIVLERKKNWWGDISDFLYNANEPEKIIFKIIKNDASAGLALKMEKLDVTTYLGTNELLKLQERDYFNETYHSEFVDMYGYTYLGMNTRPDGVEHKPFFTDKRVRRAMAHLIPLKEIIEIIVKGKAARQPSMVSPLKPSFNDTLEPIKQDIEKAKSLLDKAGWKDTDGDNVRDFKFNGEKLAFRFNLSYISSPTSKEIVLMIKDAMYQAGIDVIPTPMDFAIFYKNAQNHKFDMMMGAWSSPSGPDDPEQLWHTKNWANKGFNFCGFGDAYSDSLIVEANRTLDPEERKGIMRELQALVYDEQPYIFMYSPKRKIAIHKRFDNNNMYVERPGVILNNLKLKEKYKGSNSSKTADLFN